MSNMSVPPSKTARPEREIPAPSPVLLSPVDDVDDDVVVVVVIFFTPLERLLLILLFPEFPFAFLSARLVRII